MGSFVFQTVPHILVQAGAAASVAPVPTLGEVAMAALTLLLAALGVRRLRPTGRRGH